MEEVPKPPTSRVQRGAHRDHYGFEVSEAHVEAFQKFGPLYLLEEEERSRRWDEFLQRVAASPDAAGGGEEHLPHPQGEGPGASFKERPDIGLRAVEEALGAWPSQEGGDGGGAAESPAPPPWREELCALVAGGVPMALRGELWQVFAGVGHIRVEGRYSQLLQLVAREDTEHEAPPEARRQVRRAVEKDIPRTFPGHPAMEGEGRQALRRMLLAYSLFDPAVGYCQGMNFLAALLLLLMSEESSFWCLAALSSRYLPGYFSDRDMRRARVDQAALEHLVRDRFPTLGAHMDAQGVGVACVGTQWFICLFVNCLPWESVLRVWDVMLFQRSRDFLFKVALALLDAAAPRICRALEGGDVIQELQSLAPATFDSSGLLTIACGGFKDVSPAVLGPLRRRVEQELEQEAASREGGDDGEAPRGGRRLRAEEEVAAGPPPPSPAGPSTAEAEPGADLNAAGAGGTSPEALGGVVSFVDIMLGGAGAVRSPPAPHAMNPPFETAPAAAVPPPSSTSCEDLRELDAARAQAGELGGELAAAVRAREEAEMRRQHLAEEVAAVDVELKISEDKRLALEAQLRAQGARLAEVEAQVGRLTALLASRDSAVRARDDALGKKDATIRRLEARLAALPGGAGPPADAVGMSCAGGGGGAGPPLKGGLLSGWMLPSARGASGTEASNDSVARGGARGGGLDDTRAPPPPLKQPDDPASPAGRIRTASPRDSKTGSAGSSSRADMLRIVDLETETPRHVAHGPRLASPSAQGPRAGQRGRGPGLHDHMEKAGKVIKVKSPASASSQMGAAADDAADAVRKAIGAIHAAREGSDVASLAAAAAAGPAKVPRALLASAREHEEVVAARREAAAAARARTRGGVAAGRYPDSPSSSGPSPGHEIHLAMTRPLGRGTWASPPREKAGGALSPSRPLVSWEDEAGPGPAASPGKEAPPGTWEQVAADYGLPGGGGGGGGEEERANGRAGGGGGGSGKGRRRSQGQGQGRGLPPHYLTSTTALEHRAEIVRGELSAFRASSSASDITGTCAHSPRGPKFACFAVHGLQGARLQAHAAPSLLRGGHEPPPPPHSFGGPDGCASPSASGGGKGRRPSRRPSSAAASPAREPAGPGPEVPGWQKRTFSRSFLSNFGVAPGSSCSPAVEAASFRELRQGMRGFHPRQANGHCGKAGAGARSGAEAEAGAERRASWGGPAASPRRAGGAGGGPSRPAPSSSSTTSFSSNPQHSLAARVREEAAARMCMLSARVQEEAAEAAEARVRIRKGRSKSLGGRRTSGGGRGVWPVQSPPQAPPAVQAAERGDDPAANGAMKSHIPAPAPPGARAGEGGERWAVGDGGGGVDISGFGGGGSVGGGELSSPHGSERSAASAGSNRSSASGVYSPVLDEARQWLTTMSPTSSPAKSAPAPAPGQAGAAGRSPAAGGEGGGDGGGQAEAGEGSRGGGKGGAAPGAVRGLANQFAGLQGGAPPPSPPQSPTPLTPSPVAAASGSAPSGLAGDELEGGEQRGEEGGVPHTTAARRAGSRAAKHEVAAALMRAAGM